MLNKVNFRSICFNMHEALALINCLDKFQSEILVDSDKKIETAKKNITKINIKK